jgi:hypothetical protein
MTKSGRKPAGNDILRVDAKRKQQAYRPTETTCPVRAAVTTGSLPWRSTHSK